MSLFDPQTPRRFKNETPVFWAPHPLLVPPSRAAPGLVFSPGRASFFPPNLRLSFPLHTFHTFPSFLAHPALSALHVSASSSLHPRGWHEMQPLAVGPSGSGRAPARAPFRRRIMELSGAQKSLPHPHPRPLTLKFTLLPPSEPSKAQGILCKPFSVGGARKRPSPSCGGTFVREGILPHKCGDPGRGRGVGKKSRVCDLRTPLP